MTRPYHKVAAQPDDWEEIMQTQRKFIQALKRQAKADRLKTNFDLSDLQAGEEAYWELAGGIVLLKLYGQLRDIPLMPPDEEQFFEHAAFRYRGGQKGYPVEAIWKPKKGVPDVA